MWTFKNYRKKELLTHTHTYEYPSAAGSLLDLITGISCLIIFIVVEWIKDLRNVDKKMLNN